MEDQWLNANVKSGAYHVKFPREHIHQDLIIVGDPGRVKEVAKHFDKITFKSENREFYCCSGEIGSRQLSIVSSGIGVDNIDILLNE
ncbi:MAG: phosphorylase, partial [Luteibaculum sp.]